MALDSQCLARASRFTLPKICVTLVARVENKGFPTGRFRFGVAVVLHPKICVTLIARVENRGLSSGRFRPGLRCSSIREFASPWLAGTENKEVLRRIFLPSGFSPGQPG